MKIKKSLLILLVFLLVFFKLNAYSQKTIKVVKNNKYSYEVICDIVFPNNVSIKLIDFCWNMNNISKMLADEPVIIKYSNKDLIQTISYDYKFMFLHYYSQYERNLMPSDGKISFKLIKNECTIPFIPNVLSGYGEYLIKSDNKTTIMHYYQYIKCDGTLRDFYFDYIKNDVESYFNKFETEFIKTLKNAKN